MTRILATVLLLSVAPLATAGGSKAAGGPVVPTATISPRSATPIPVCARLQPIVGSVQRVGSHTHPINHTAKYSYGTYNPIAGQFGTGTFRR